MMRAQRGMVQAMSPMTNVVLAEAFAALPRLAWRGIMPKGVFSLPPGSALAYSRADSPSAEGPP